MIQNGSNRVPKTIRMEPNGRQKGTTLSTMWSKIKPWSVRGLFFFKIKNGRGALVSLTGFKGTSVDGFFIFEKKKESVVPGTCRSYLT